MASIINNIPEAAWISMGNTVVNQVCNLTYYDKSNGDKELKRHPKREILTIITDFLQNNINLREANLDEKFKADFFTTIAEQMKPPIAKMYENDLMAIRFMEGILKEYPYIFMNIINVIAQQSADELTKVGSKKETFISIFMKKITTYTNVDNEVSKNINKDTEPESSQTENEQKLYEMENEDISGVQDTLVTNIKKYGFLKNADNIDHLKKVSNDEVIKHIDSLIDTIVTSSEEQKKTEDANSPLSMLMNNNITMDPLAMVVKEAIGDMPKEFVERIFATLEKSDAKQYSEIKEDIYKTILSALRYHLEKPEGRQMYLRQIEPIVRNYAVKSLINDDTTIICIFQLIRDSPKINTFIRKTVDATYKKKNTNFANPSFQDMRKFTGGAIRNPFKVFREKTEPFVNKVFGKTPAPDSTAPDSTAPDSTAPDSPAPDSYGIINEPYDMSKIISEYKNTFAYDVYQLLETEIQTLIKSNDPIAKMYNDLDQFKVPKLAKINKNAIDYAKTMCSPGIMKKEIAQSKPTYKNISSSGNKEPATNVGESATNVGESATNVKEPETNVASQTTGVNGLYKTANVKEPETNVKEPETNVKEPETNVKEPETNVKEPETNVASQTTGLNGLYNTANVGDAAQAMSAVPPNLANQAMSFLTPSKKGGNIHKTYRRMIQKRHKYTRKT